MADNFELNAGSGGSTLAVASLTFSGDTAGVQIVGCGILSGSEGSWTLSQFVGGAGAVAAGVQRVTLASDDPAVVDLAAIEVLLGTIDADTGAIKTAVELIDNAVYGAGFNITQFAGEAVPLGAGVESTALRVTVATDSTGVLSVDDNGGSLTVDNAALAVVGEGTVTAATLRVTQATDDDGVAHLATIAGDTTSIDADMTALLAAVATSANQTTANAALSTIAADTTSIDADMTALLAAVATSANQTTANTSLATIAGDTTSLDGKVTTCNTDAVDITDDVTRLLGKIANYDVLANGTLGALNETVSLASANLGTAGVGISGTWAGTIVAEGDVGDGVWATIPLIHSLTGAALASTTGNGNWFIGVAGFLNVRIRMSLYTSGTATVYIEGTAAPAGVFLNRSIPTGGNLIGSVLLTAGDSNVGNVDIVTLPSGNLGMQAMAASLSVVPASDITDATYIGDIKFGESLPAGTNAIGKLAANTGVDIGDVDVTSIVPGTAATNLGKARASALGATDTGVAALGVRNDDLADLAGADADYTPLQVNSEGALYVTEAAAEVKRASGVAAGGAPGTDNMVAAVASRYIRVLALGLFATSTTVNNVFIDNADNDLLFNTGNPLPLSLDADGDTVAGFVLPYNPGGWFQTDTVNEAVTLNTSAAQDIAYTITYIEVP
jgi:hypothetical protein